MWNPFRGKPVETAKAEPTSSLAEGAAHSGMAGRINAAIEKSAVDDTMFYNAYSDAHDGGNFFGSEFNILATGGRIKSTYAKEPWMYATATILARTLSSIPFIVVNAVTDEPMPDHPLNKQLKANSHIQDATSIKWNGFLDLVLGGNAYLCFNDLFSSAVLAPTEDVMVHLSDDKTYVQCYSVASNDGRPPRMVPAKQVIHFKYPNPYNPFYGLSIYTAASRPVLLDRYKNEFEMAFYLRGATNSGVIETTEDIAKSRLERLLASFEQTFTGKRNWWRTIFLPKGAKWISSGLTMQQMQHLEGMRENRLTFLATIGIPPSMVGIVQDVNRATSEIQNEIFWNNTIKPMADFYASGWNNSYLVKMVYRNMVKVIPDYSAIEALKGSLVTRGEQAKAVEPYLTLNEIRTDVLKYKPLPPEDPRGNKLVAEIKPAASSPFGALGLGAEQTQSNSDVTATTQELPQVTAPVEVAPEKEVARLRMKSTAVAGQGQLEEKLSALFQGAYNSYLQKLLQYAEFAISNSSDIRGFIKSKERVLAKEYVEMALPVLQRALDRGFSLAVSQSKFVSELKRRIKIMNGGNKKDLRFTETDQQAIDAIRERDENGQRQQLMERAIRNFQGFNQTRTDEIMGMIEAGLGDGKTLDQISASIRQDYGEQYPNQASTITRTEVLSAVSQGLKWNHEVLGEIFTEVEKQWFSVDDSSVRPEHLAYENEGAVPKDHKWGGVLEMPRDPAGDASDTINCRCTMVSVVPEGAESNAAVILDNLV